MKTDIALAKIRRFFRRQKRLPTYQELANILGFASKNAAYKLAQKLIKAGYLEKDRTGKLVPRRLFAPLPNSGIVQAGFPVPAEEELDDLVSIDEFLIDRPDATFMLRVSGDSMIDAGICPGDMVLIERGRKPRDGDVVVANIDGEWTMKYYSKSGRRIILAPANKKYKAITPKQSLELAGVVISVIRKYH